jgi:dGTPase
VSHDVDDATRAGVLDESDLPERVRRLLGETYRERLDAMVRSMVAESAAAESVCMPQDVADAIGELRSFLFEKVYLGAARAEALKAADVLRDLCGYYRRHPDELPATDPDLDQRVIDYVSGMTDRFALRAYAELFLPKGLT